MAVVGRRRQEQPMLEPARQVIHRAGELTVHGVPGATRRRGMVRLIQNQEATRPELPERLTQAGYVRFICEEVVRDQEPRPGQPGVGEEASAPSECHDVLTVDDRESQTELGL